MSKLVKVVAVYFDDEPRYAGINSGLVLELEDGRILHHSQDGAVVPFEVVKETLPKDENKSDGRDIYDLLRPGTIQQLRPGKE